MGNIRVGLKIIPSANTEANIVIMDYVQNTEEDNKNKNVDKSYHSFSNTKEYFPEMTLKKEYVPFGDPDPYCFFLSWSEVGKSKQFGRYQPFNGLSRCSLLDKGHVLWKKSDPKEGINIKMWHQEIFSLDNGQNDCDSEGERLYQGIYAFDKGFSYSVVQSIGFKVEETSGSNDIKDHKWEVIEGGYRDGEYTKMSKAVPGVEYDFSHVPIEVRAYADPFAGDTEEEDLEARDPSRKTGGFSFLKFLAWIAFIVFIIALVVWGLLMASEYLPRGLNSEEKRSLVKSKVLNRETEQ